MKSRRSVLTIFWAALALLVCCLPTSAIGDYVCGDANGDGSLNVGDAVFIINHVFKGGPAPDPNCCAECQPGETRPCYTGPAGTEDVGPCSAGIQTCVAGVWGPCEGETLPGAEECDGVDNDCNGVADDGLVRACYTGPPGTEDVGECNAGTQTCVAGVWSPCAGETLPGIEECDGLDNDCDGIEDNNLTPPPCELTQGVCAGAVMSCNGPGGWLTCSASDYGPDYEPTEATCDGLDNDCDGIVDEGCCPPTVTDYDGNVYQTIQIGDQCWMMENLKVTHYRNGDPIPNITDNGEWEGLATGAFCNYNNDEGYVAAYGRLYNWYAVDDARNIAPEGWHVATDEELKQLEMYLGMSQSQADSTGWRGTGEGGKLKEAGTTHWTSPNTGATNESGFTALPGGYRSGYGYFDIMGRAYFWSTTEYSGYYAWYRGLHFVGSLIARDGSAYKLYGLSVRCVRD